MVLPQQQLPPQLQLLLLLPLLLTFFAACHHRSSKSRMRSGDTLLASSLHTDNDSMPPQDR
jgi:hypothetical protein